MIVVKTVEGVRKERWKNKTLSWGFVPTMGALHAGHTSLVRRAKKGNDRVGVSIFVNPKQFNNPNDLKTYPRTLKQDLELVHQAGTDLVWIPNVDEVYPPNFQTYIHVEDVTKPLEGAARPGHFVGMATIVNKLLNVFEPTRAYFGQKDAQQVVVVKQMVMDLNMNTKIIVCPTVRERDGLAMSSRNVRLHVQERKAATILYKSLIAAKTEWNAGYQNSAKLKKIMRIVLKTEPLARIEYVSVANPITLEEIDGITNTALLSMAVFIGDVRLIDNIILK